MANQLKMAVTSAIQEAAGNGLNHAEFLELVLQDKMLVRKERQIKRRIKTAMFKDLKTLEDFDWQFNPSIKKKQIFDLASCRFIRECRDSLFLGPPGTGKSHGSVTVYAAPPGATVLLRPSHPCATTEQTRPWANWPERIHRAHGPCRFSPVCDSCQP